MSKILVISGHPHLDRSNMNAAILESLEDKFNGDILEVRRLDELYPDFNIDAKAEQEALVDADIIVLQFPIYWYNVPSLLNLCTPTVRSPTRTWQPNTATGSSPGWSKSAHNSPGQQPASTPPIAPRRSAVLYLSILFIVTAMPYTPAS